MSWNPFNRLISAPRKSVIPRTEERDFEREVHKIEVLDEATKRLGKDMKKCNECMQTLSKAQSKITQDLAASPVCQSEDELKPLDELNSGVYKLENLTQELNANAYKTMIEPMKKFSTIFPNIYSSLKKREQLLQEYRKCQAKVEKYQDRDKTGTNIVKLETSKKSLNTAKEEYESLHQPLSEELPKFFEDRIEYFQPCFEALIKSQIEYYTDSYKLFDEMSGQLSDGQALTMTNDAYEDQLHMKLNEIRALSIVVDD
ncbi:bridging integrator 3-like [Glandiceps talaboti]